MSSNPAVEVETPDQKSERRRAALPVNAALRAYFKDPSAETISNLLSAANNFLYKSTLVDDGSVRVSGYLAHTANGDLFADETTARLWRKLPTYPEPNFTLTTLIAEGHTTSAALKLISASRKLMPIDNDVTGTGLVTLLRKMANDIRASFYRRSQERQILFCDFEQEDEDGGVGYGELDAATKMVWGNSPSTAIVYTRKSAGVVCDCDHRLPVHTTDIHYDNYVATNFNPGPPTTNAPLAAVNRQFKLTDAEYDHLMSKQDGICIVCKRTLIGETRIGVSEQLGLVHASEACGAAFICKRRAESAAWFPDRDTVLGNRLWLQNRSRSQSGSYHAAERIKGGEKSARQRRINALEFIVNGSRMYGERAPEQIATLEGSRFSYAGGPGRSIFSEARPHELDADGKIENTQVIAFERHTALGFWRRADTSEGGEIRVGKYSQQPLPEFVFTTRVAEGKEDSI